MNTELKSPLFDAPAFALEIRLAMAEANISYRQLAALIGSDQASCHRVAKKALPPSIETYLRLKLWLEQRRLAGIGSGVSNDPCVANRRISVVKPEHPNGNISGAYGELRVF